MGKVYDSILAGTSGRTGRVVIANVFGTEYTRIRPRKRSGTPTQKQLLIQSRMTRCTEFMESYRPYACQHFGQRIGISAPFNLAMTNLMTNFVLDFAADTINIQYPNISFSKGKLLAAIPTSVAISSPGTLQINWQDNSAGNPVRATDWIQILVAAEDEILTSFAENATQRSAESYDFILPPNFSGKVLHVWVAFRNQDGTLVSNSTYAGSPL
jgi:hypothetical protein